MVSTNREMYDLNEWMNGEKKRHKKHLWIISPLAEHTSRNEEVENSSIHLRWCTEKKKLCINVISVKLYAVCA